MNSLILQLCYIACIGLFIILNRLGWGDPRIPLGGLFVVMLLWLLTAVFVYWGDGRLLVSRVFNLSSTNTYGSEQANLLAISVNVVLALVPILMLVLLLAQSKQVPAIHDITTDTVNPPLFSYADQSRHSAHNSSLYDESNIPLQQSAYPHIQPLIVASSPSDVIVAIETLISDQGWVLQGVDTDRGLVEAYAITGLFGFVDDTVFRVQPYNKGEFSGSRIDIRSASRIGKSDFGANAKRIAVAQQILLVVLDKNNTSQ